VSQPPSVTVADLSHSGFMLDAGLNYRVVPSVSLAFVAYNLFGGDDGRAADAGRDEVPPRYA